MRIVWSATAHGDLARVREFHLAHSEAYGSRVERRLLERAAMLARSPLQGRRIAGSDVRAVSLNDIQYVLTYRPLPNLIVISGVYSTREVRGDEDLLR